MQTPKTMFDKVWEQHSIAQLGSGFELLHVDRLMMHDFGGPMSFAAMNERGLDVANPELVYATPDHLVTSEPGQLGGMDDTRSGYIDELREQCAEKGIQLFDVDDSRQGIVHVVGPELGITLPGTTVLCGDSHTCTHGGVGAVAWGIGTSEQNHIMATQCIIEKKPKTMRLSFVGHKPENVTAKDMILRAIAVHGSSFGKGFAVEYCGDAISSLSIEERMTICNMSVEFGAKIGFVAPDQKAIDYLRGREFAPPQEQFEIAKEHWLSLNSDEHAVFDSEIVVEIQELQPQISWGTNPAQTIDVDGVVPSPSDAPDDDTRRAWQSALEYMDLEPGRQVSEIKIDHVFIGSCTNSRLSDLEAAAAIVKGKRVADGVTAWVVPGSQKVKSAAENSGLDIVFKQAGFDWREPGCSLCPAANGDAVPSGKRCVSTSNRNFMGRQGPGARTHLASPETAAASAIAGVIADPRKSKS